MRGQDRGHGRERLGPGEGGRGVFHATDFVSSSFVLEGQRPRGEYHHDHGNLLDQEAQLERCPTFHKDMDTKICNQNNTSLAVISASAAGNCLDNAVVMSQQAEHWQFPVSHRHW